MPRRASQDHPRPTRSDADDPHSGPASLPFPVVGLGASAGGLDALERFLTHLSPEGTWACVVVQHLDPTRPGILATLLQRVTPMPVIQVQDREPLRPRHVYVIPPGRTLTLLRGHLYLSSPAEPIGLRLPIDAFFRSLAQEQGAAAIGVVLSGMGSDGTLGAKAIKSHGGLVLAQDPDTAAFKAMPESILQANLADATGAPEWLASRLEALFAAKREGGTLPPPEDEPPVAALEAICRLLRHRTGHDFSGYKKSTVFRRVERRMGVHALPTPAAYIQHLHTNPLELDLLFKELLIGVTSFFRDSDAWLTLSQEVLPALLAAHPEGGTLRAWVAGCSTGEEAFSLAMAFRETAERLQAPPGLTLQIFATDLDRDAIERARQGLFAPGSLNGLSEERRARWFHQEEKAFRIHKEIREMVVFAIQDVNQDPPFIRLDLLLCRNLLIYLSADLQKRLIPLFHYSLKPDGVLFLGSAESIGGYSDLFTPLPGRARLFRRTPHAMPLTVAPFPVSPSPAREGLSEPLMPKSVVNLQSLADQVLLQRFAPPAVLTTDTGDIVYISGRTGRYLEPAMGKANWNVFAMAREGLRNELGLAFRKALTQKEPVTVKGIRVTTEDRLHGVDLTIQVLEAPESLQGLVMVVFQEQALPTPKPRRTGKQGPATQARIAELEAELKTCWDELQTHREEMQTSQEELKATNEELQSTNEELQSTNEELTTSKEELQSLNEELQTVNAEQQAKVDELSAMNNDIKNLLDATEIATLFLDEQLNVRRFTKGATRLFKLIPGDIGRPITDMVNDLDYPSLAPDALEVLRTLVFCEKEIKALQGQAWFSVRILPYRTVQNAIGGVVITFTDITRAKQLEAELRRESNA